MSTLNNEELAKKLLLRSIKTKYALNMATTNGFIRAIYHSDYNRSWVVFEERRK